MPEKLIALAIIANGRYCNNDCQFMRPDAGSCELFGELVMAHPTESKGTVSAPRDGRYSLD